MKVIILKTKALPIYPLLINIKILFFIANHSIYDELRGSEQLLVISKQLSEKLITVPYLLFTDNCSLFTEIKC